MEEFSVLEKNGGLLNEQQVPVGQFSPSHSGSSGKIWYPCDPILHMPFSPDSQK